MTTVLGFTRPAQKLKESVKEAEDMGFSVMSAPSMDIDMGDDAEFDKFSSSVVPGAIVVFASASSVEMVAKRFGNMLSSMLNGCRVISIGPATTKELAKNGVTGAEEPSDYSSYGALEMLKGDVSGKTVVIARSDRGSDVLKDGLTEAGADVVTAAVYKIREIGMGNGMFHMMIAIKRGRLDVLAMTSPASAESFFESMFKQYGEDVARGYLSKIKIAAIGTSTTQKLRELGREPDIVPSESTFHDMLLAIRNECEGS